MNTSNKILTGFTAFALLLPLAIMMTLKSKVTKGEYVTRTYGSQYHNSWQNASLDGVKALRFVNTGTGKLKVNINNADTASLGYSRRSEDSILVVRSGDTAVITYRSTLKPGNEFYREPSIQVNIPGLKLLILENTEATMLSWESPGQGAMDVLLQSSAQLNLGQQDETGYQEPQPAADPFVLDSVNIHLDNARLKIGGNVSLEHLGLDAQGKSVITINPGSRISNLSGSLSDSSAVNAGWNHLKAFTPSNK